MRYSVLAKEQLFRQVEHRFWKFSKSVQLEIKSLFTLIQNRCSDCARMSVQLGPEYQKGQHHQFPHKNTVLRVHYSYPSLLPSKPLSHYRTHPYDSNVFFGGCFQLFVKTDNIASIDSSSSTFLIDLGSPSTRFFAHKFFL